MSIWNLWSVRRFLGLIVVGAFALQSGGVIAQDVSSDSGVAPAVKSNGEKSVADETAGDELGFRDLFNGKDLTGWVDVNTSPETWSVRDGVMVCTGLPIGVMRSERQYENFILEIEWRHMELGGNSGVFLWCDANGNGTTHLNGESKDEDSTTRRATTTDCPPAQKKQSEKPYGTSAATHPECPFDSKPTPQRFASNTT